MLIELLLDLVFEFFKILPDFDIPSLPPEISEIFYTVFDYISQGIAICNAFMPMYYFGVLFGILISIDVILILYHFILWIINKIPWLDID